MRWFARESAVVGLCLLVLNSGIASGAPSKSKHEGDGSIVTARNLLRDGKYSQCVSYINNSLSGVKKRDPAHLGDWYEILAMCQYYDHYDPLPIAFTAYRMDKNSARRLSTLAFAYLKKRKYEDAAQAARKAVALDDKDARAHAVLGYACLKLHDDAKAKPEIERAISLAPMDMDVNLLAVSYFQHAADAAGTRLAIERAIKGNPNCSRVYYARALYLRDRHDDDSALKDLARAVRLNDEYIDALALYGRALQQKNRYREAIAQYNRFLQISVQYGVMYRRGDSYRRVGELDKALADLTRSLQLIVPGGDTRFDPAFQSKMNHNIQQDYKDIWIERVRLFDQMGQPEKAISQINSMLEVIPNDSQALYVQRDLLLKSKQYKAALLTLDKIIARESEVAVFYEQRASVYDKLSDGQAAEKDRQKAKRLRAVSRRM